MNTERADRRIASLGARQHGLLTRAQAVRAGATRSMIHGRLTSGRWERLHPGVYRLAGVPGSWRQSLMAACLSAGGEAVVSHRAAAALWLLPGFVEGVIELTLLHQRARHNGFIVHRVSSLPRADVVVIDEIPVTSPARTLIDLASVTREHVLEEALDDVLRRKLVKLARLRRRIDELGGRGRRGIPLIRSLVEARARGGAVPDRVFETRLLRLIRDGGLPKPVLQYEVRTGERLIAVIDFAFPDASVAVEAEGYRWHSGRARWERDLARRNVLAAQGWRVVHVTWNDLKYRPDGTLRGIRTALAEGMAARRLRRRGAREPSRTASTRRRGP